MTNDGPDNFDCVAVGAIVSSATALLAGVAFAVHHFIGWGFIGMWLAKIGFVVIVVVSFFYAVGRGLYEIGAWLDE